MQTLKALSELNLAYGKSFDKTQLNYYVRKLSDIHPVTLGAAVSHICNTSKFLPTVAEIREVANRISDEVNQIGQAVELTPEEAWAEVYKAACSCGYEVGLERLSGNVLRTAKSLWHDICYCPNGDLSMMRAHYIRAYKENQARNADKVKIDRTIQSVPALNQARKTKLEQLQAKLDEVKSIEGA